MDPCKPQQPFTSFYLYENGKPCDPEKLRVRRADIEKCFTKEGKCFFYKAKALYTVAGERVKDFANVGKSEAYVLVIAHEKFICSKYKEAFETMKKQLCDQKKKLEGREKSKTRMSSTCSDTKSMCDNVSTKKATAPSCPPSACSSTKIRQKTVVKEAESCSDRKKPKDRCASVDKNPCDQDSDEDICPTPQPPKSKPRQKVANEDPCADKKKRERSVSYRNPCEQDSACSTPKPSKSKPRQKRAVCGDVCKPKSDDSEEEPQEKEHQHCVTEDKYPCCDEDSDLECPKPAKPKRKSAGKQKTGFWASCCPCCVKSPTGCEDDSRPVSKHCGNMKMTQTCPEDFKRAKRCLKLAIKEEKRRLKAYGRNQRKSKSECAEKMQKSQKDGGDGGCDDREKEKREADYRKARDKYRQKRKQMEKQINKALEKEMKKRKC